MKASSDSGPAPERDVHDVTATPRRPAQVREQAAGRARDGSWASGFLLAHWAPVLALAALAVILTAFHGDQWLADRLYAWQGHRWPLRSAFITEDLIHIIGRDLSTAVWLGVLAAWVVTRFRPGLSSWRVPLASLLVSTLLATAVVAWIKSWSNMDCPWDLTRYGGAREYVGLLSLRPVGMPRAACFPAGHASAGYAWMALYFFFLATRPQWRWLGLAAGISLGLLFGVVQQLRGAHFLSHDLWTAAICWACALGGYLLYGGRSHVFEVADIPASVPQFDIAPRAPRSWQRSAGAK
ncbi:MAG: phosphatase PAP2 family protein [Lysobacter sp.]